MRSLNRRKFLAGATAATAATLAPTRARAQKSGGTLRFVAQADLKILDPVWTTAYITRNHSYLVYDTLFTFLPDPLGTQGWLRPNHPHPPFNNKKARQALVAMMSQEMYWQAAIGEAGGPA